MDQYRRPFKDAGEGRRSTLNWARKLPFEDEPVNIVKIVSKHSEGKVVGAIEQQTAKFRN
ncbi:hypothetical protein TH53_17520 [Pedobacter lusitanus]|uniref:Uncharacterized protein n=1 Tax=Pedobacter lusitanus TaxID=1503925 RepID=A0A0D0GIP4_9SPHI|nr:hypothetical protein TH53_17520 [Pedobacter lusitanus]